MDESCGVTFVAFRNPVEASKLELNSILTENTYIVVDKPQGDFAVPAVGKAERKGVVTGGLKIWSSSTGSTGWCTSNVVFRKGTSERWLVTAAHCVRPGAFSGSPTQVSVVTNQNWYQGIGAQNSTNRVSLGATQYFWFGGDNDIMAIQLNDNRAAPTPQNKSHESVQPGPVDFYKLMLWWYYNMSLDTPGLTVCHSGYTSNMRDCGILNHTNDSISWSSLPPQNMPYTTTVGHIRFAGLMTTCQGDSGGTVWGEQVDGNNIAGIVHAINGIEFTRTQEGIVQGCNTGTYYTSISTATNLGLAAPWNMS